MFGDLMRGERLRRGGEGNFAFEGLAVDGTQPGYSQQQESEIFLKHCFFPGALMNEFHRGGNSVALTQQELGQKLQKQKSLPLLIGWDYSFKRRLTVEPIPTNTKCVRSFRSCRLPNRRGRVSA